MRKFYLTTAIPYVNSSPHVGHALEFVQADVVGRYHRMIGDETLLLTGADENALKNVQAAEKAGITPLELCDKNSEKFRDLLSSLKVSYDRFQRGSDKVLHWPGVAKLWDLCFKNGDIYKKTYTGLYCVGCEEYYTEDELVNGLCPEHKTKPELVSEENYFFRLSRYQEKLLSLIETNKLFIIPDTRRREVLSFIKSGLSDFSVSRSINRAKNWGVPVPRDSSQIIYVWFDALDIYMTGVGFGTDETNWKKWWPADLHIIGKGIIRFHAIYWIAMLLSANLPLPKSLFVHGYVTSDGTKMSKSLGNVIDPFDFINKYGVDPVRYYLLKEIPAYADGDFTERRFLEVYNADLANGLGNLVSRISRLSENAELKVENTTEYFDDDYSKAILEFRFNDALELIIKQEAEADLILDKKAPWKLLKEGNKEEAKEVLLDLVSRIRKITFHLKPFLPETAEKIEKIFVGPNIKASNPLFPRYD